MPPLTADHPSGASDCAGRSSVKARLTPNRRRRRVQNDEYASFVRCVIRAHARRVAAGDVDALADMTGLTAELDEAITQAVAGFGRPGTRGPGPTGEPSSNASSKAAGWSWTTPDRLDRTTAGQPRIRTDSDRLNTGRARLLIRGFWVRAPGAPPRLTWGFSRLQASIPCRSLHFRLRFPPSQALVPRPRASPPYPGGRKPVACQTLAALVPASAPGPVAAPPGLADVQL
jgi:ribosomal protein S20